MKHDLRWLVLKTTVLLGVMTVLLTGCYTVREEDHDRDDDHRDDMDHHDYWGDRP
jgi:hypothetical protein